MEVISICNQKGGCAKTTTAMNLGATLAREGKRTLLVDLDPQATLTRSLGVRQSWNLYADGLQGVETSIPGLDLVPGGPALVSHEMDLTRAERFNVLRPLVSEVRGYDYLLIDCPPNLYGSTTNAVVAAERLLIPAPLDVPVLQSLTDTVRLIESLRKKKLPVPEWVAGVITIYHKTAMEPQLLRLAERVFPSLLDTRIRRSTVYTRAGLKQTAAVVIGTKGSAPVLDHRALAQEMKLV